MPTEHSQIDIVIAAVLDAPKYRNLAPDLVRAVAVRELAAHRGVKAAIKGTKSKLHQVAGAYVEQRIAPAVWLDRLRSCEPAPGARDAGAALVQAGLANPRFAHLGDQFLHGAIDLMARHASTRERLPILQRFYAETLVDLPPICSVLDAGCGLNPLALPWMPLAADAAYYASDIDRMLISFIAQYLALIGVPGEAHVRDQATNPGGPRVDLALALKLLPVLEQLERGAAARFLDALDAPFILVSYPARSLGGYARGMHVAYERQFAALASGKGWDIRRFVFPGELAFLIKKGAAP